MTSAALFAGGLAAGLLAGTASCTAVQGGLLIGLVQPPRTTGVSSCCAPGAAPSPSSPGLVAAFLGGRLATHTTAGALLGLLGGATPVPPQARAVLLIASGAAVALYATRLLLRHRHPTEAVTSTPPPPASPLRRRRGEERCGEIGAVLRRLARPGGHSPPNPPRRIMSGRAAALGAATILVPCGVTLTTEVVAVSSGSWLGGAAVMAGFTAGTAPAFAALGLLLRRLATTRLAAVAALAALVAGVVTMAAGLRLGGWLPEIETSAPAAAGASVRADGTQVITIWSTDQGYRPAVAAVEAGRPTEIVFRTRENHGCTRSVTIQGHDITLPVSGETTVRLAPQSPGRLRYVCGMGMYTGVIDINRPGAPPAR
ncbi:sulfite exporter TauE/SafE family protein [Sphaerisporangium fuscum]|uniref:sulfite exporter TauE/SafE family protein n=1 Tax=Sphaerisporangium fuscum TaxID=2835868 RepID=UPI001BDC510E|nr:sulfite exporter TauE/SafE family protein [Sphaerisporangium fuscum]